MTRRGIAAVLGLEAATLAVASALHLSGADGGGSKPFDPTSAGMAEAVIGVALLAGVLALLALGSGGRRIALGAVGFAIAGFVVGLNFTIRGGGAADVAYHATMLPLLLCTLVLLGRGRWGQSLHGV